MTFKTHLVASAALCAAASILGVIDITSNTGKIAAAGVVLGGMIPDIDSPNSKINGILWRFSPIKPRDILQSTYNHRKYPTHWPLFWSVILAAIYYYLTINHHSTAWVLGLAIGVAGHFICDMFNSQGIMILMPFLHKRFRFAQIATGSFGEYIFLGIILISFVALIGSKMKVV